jgi:hypothetical protein
MVPADQVVMVEWVRELYERGKVLDAADKRLGGDFDEQQMARLMIVGLFCVHSDRNLRPSIKQAIHVLNFEASVPVLPLNTPGPSYPARAINRLTSSLSKSSGAIDSRG